MTADKAARGKPISIEDGIDADAETSAELVEAEEVSAPPGGYGAAAAKYIDAFFANIQWPAVEKRFEGIKKV